MNSDDFFKNLSFGQDSQDIVVNFLERHYGYKFEAGERYGTILNTDLIEEIENCEILYPSKNRFGGTKLLFRTEGKEYKVSMPDVLMSRNSSSGFYWIEVKRSNNDSNLFKINKKNFLDYKILYEKFTRQDFYAMCLNPRLGENTYDLYWCDIGKLINSPYKEEGRNGNEYLLWDMNKVMQKLNQYPIDIEKYK